ncbi:MAG: caspase family protein [Deltaproteobacteria bacterium]|nr:caspase family protein [Deltaproteobacteria bacterium]
MMRASSLQGMDDRACSAAHWRLGRPLIAALLACASLAAPASAADRRFAVVVGFNGSDDATLSPLAYADDDALRYGELFGNFAEQVETLTTPDAETRGLWGDAHDAAPTRAAVLGALSRTHEAMRAARAAGDRAILFFVYSGHGNYDAEGRGYVHLADGRFTTRDLYRHVIAESEGAPVVLVVDACNAALLVHSRGAPERRPAGETMLRLESWPNVGVILASSAVAETHEWGRYLAGIFSHEVRSALLGPADLNDDGRITFGELASFVAAANARVTNPAVRITPYIRPPLDDPELALVDLATARFPARIRVGDGVVGKAHLVDDDLVRLADFHKSAGEHFWLSLPHAGPYVLVFDTTEYLVSAGASGPLELGELERRERTVLSARGAGSDYFERTLFKQPFGRDYAWRYLAGDYLPGLEVRRLVERPWYENGPAWGLAGSGAAALAGGLGLSLAARAREREASDPDTFGDRRARLNDDIDRFQTAAWVMYGVGGAAVLGSALWFALDRPVAEERYMPPLEVSVTPGGVTLRRDF